MAAVSLEQIEALLEELRRRFEADYAANPVIAAILEKAERREATYADARRYASEVDRLCGRATADFTLRTSQGVDPAFYRDNFREFQSALLPNVLDRNYQLIADYCEKVQKGLNEGAGLGLKAQRVWQDQDRVTGIVKHVTRADSPEQAAQRASRDMAALDTHYVNRSIQVNADWHYKLGLFPKIVRTGGAKCCEWCAEVEGTFTYPDVPKDVFRNHEECKCSIDYNPGDGKTEHLTVGDNKRWGDYSDELVQERKEFGLHDDRDPAKIEMRKAFGIESSSRGNPAAIVHFGEGLSAKQERILELLPEYDSRVNLPKNSVTMRDLAALTAKTGDEFALFRRPDGCYVIRGNATSVNIHDDDARMLSRLGYRWTGHTHPGADEYCLAPSGGDYRILDCFENQESSSIWNSMGKHREFWR